MSRCLTTRPIDGGFGSSAVSTASRRPRVTDKRLMLTVGVFLVVAAVPGAWAQPWSPQLIDLFADPVYSVGYSNDLTVGDIDGDGAEDVVVASDSASEIKVFLNDRYGRYVEVAGLPFAEPVTVKLADFDGDGLLDIVAGSAGAGGEPALVRIWRNLGAAVFSVPEEYAALPGTPALATGDLNGDGFVDVAVSCDGSKDPPNGGLSIFLGNGDGTLQTRQDLEDSYELRSVAIGDFNGDGLDDIATTGIYQDYVTLYLNVGNAVFQPYHHYSGYWPRGLEVGDVNGDGALDLAVHSGDKARAAGVLVNSGTGSSFEYEGLVTTRTTPVDVALGDWTGDGMDDLVVANSYLALHTSVGDGTFLPIEECVVMRPAAAPVIADVDNDGFRDVVTLADSVFGVLMNNRDGTLRRWGKKLADVGFPRAIAAGDLNGDETVDLVYGDYYGDIGVLLNAGDGTFTTAQTFVADGTHPYSIVLGDLDGDDAVDLAVAAPASNRLGLYRNNGDGTFQQGWQYPGVPSNPYHLAIGELSGDGALDLVVTNDGGLVSVLLNQGDGTFGPQQQLDAGLAADSPRIGDLNGDGAADIVVSQQEQSLMIVYFNNGDGTFQPRSDIAVVERPAAVALGDLNGDAALDAVVVASPSGPDETAQANVLFGNGDGSFQGAVAYTIGHAASMVEIADLDGDEDPDVVVLAARRGVAHVLLNDGSGTFVAQQDFAVGRSSPGAPLADLDGDCDLDLVVRDIRAKNIMCATNLWPAAVPGDLNCDRDVLLSEVERCLDALAGADISMPPAGVGPGEFRRADSERDGDVDLVDIAGVQVTYSGL
jgi:hypothetical protein